MAFSDNMHAVLQPLVDWDSDYLWSRTFWLPHNISWDDFFCEDTTPPSFVNALDCLYFVVLLSILRFLLSRYLWKPVGLAFGLRYKSGKLPEDNPQLEAAFLRNKRPRDKDIMELCMSLSMDRRSVECWLRRRRNREKSPQMRKFVESGWRFSYYTVLFSYGLFVLWDKTYVYKVNDFYKGYPCHIMPIELHIYYVVQLGYYVSAMFWLNFDVKRKDSSVMILHHVTTVALLLFSYVTNYHRIGAVILALHDVADCWMECAKMFKYIRYNRIAESIFFGFILVWILTRLYYFPFWVIHSVIFVLPDEVGVFPAQKLFLTFLLILQVLHIFWFILIIKVAVQTFTNGEKATDCRSDSELSDDTENSLTQANVSHNVTQHITHNGEHISNGSVSYVNSTTSRRNRCR